MSVTAVPTPLTAHQRSGQRSTLADISEPRSPYSVPISLRSLGGLSRNDADVSGGTVSRNCVGDDNDKHRDVAHHATPIVVFVLRPRRGELHVYGSRFVERTRTHRHYSRRSEWLQHHTPLSFVKQLIGYGTCRAQRLDTDDLAARVFKRPDGNDVRRHQNSRACNVTAEHIRLTPLSLLSADLSSSALCRA
jgi:hypothetical protein